MRCASCGTQNEPDSRFCGGCGARLPAGETRLAPTPKVTNDTSALQPSAQPVTPVRVSASTPSPGLPQVQPSRAPSPAVIPATPIPGATSPVTLQRGSSSVAARGPSAQQSAAPSARAQSAAPVSRAPSAPVVESQAASLGSEPGRMQSPLRSIPGTGAGVGGIPGTGAGIGGIPGTGAGVGGIPGTGAGIPGTGVGGIPGTGIPGTRSSSSPSPTPARPAASSGAGSSRRLGLIIGVIVVDLVLAVAGAW